MDMEYTARLRAVVRLTHDIRHSAAEIARTLRTIGETLDVEGIRESETYGVEGLQFAWTTFLWFWGGWRTDCESLITELSLVIEHLNSWNPPSRKSRAVCFRLVGGWCEELVARLVDWFDALHRVNPEAFEWAVALRVTRHAYRLLG